MNILYLVFVTIAFIPQMGFCEAIDKEVIFEPINVDLNGDGFQDYGAFICYDPKRGSIYGSSGYERFVLDINNQFIISRGCGLHGIIHIVDIDTTDAYKEIAIPQSGWSSDNETHFYYFTGDSIIFMGTLPGTYDIICDGSGEVQTKQRGNILHTWFYPASYKLNEDRRFVFVEKELYPMNTSVTLRCDLTLQVALLDPTVAVVLHAGDKGTIVASDDRKWCLFENERGVRGWFAIESFCKIVGTKMDARDVFDGLHLAD